MNPAKYNVLITGANSDIGYELCEKYLKLGGYVNALYNSNHDNLDKLEVKYKEKIKIHKGDFEKPNFVENFINDNSMMLSDVNIFIHLAAVRESILYGEITSGNLLKHFTVNVVPVVLLIQHLSNMMMKKTWGRIVIGSSIGVKFGGGNDTYCYSLTKFASELLPKAHKQWASENVLINSVRIGVTDTSGFRKIGEKLVRARENLIPMKRIAQPQEIANAIFHLASNENTYITGQTISVSGGE